MTRYRRVVLIGHRGVGKSSLLGRITKAYASLKRDIVALDLDQEIEKRTGRTVSEVFAQEGEMAFRALEKKVFTDLENETETASRDVFISLGAGFDVSAVSSQWHAIWIRRLTDESGRIFTDRPRLEKSGSALEEFHVRANQRTPKFAARADDVLFLDEGIEDADDPAEREFFLETLSSIARAGVRGIGGALTITADQIRPAFESWLRERVFWGVRWFELRDDLLTIDQMNLVLRTVPLDKILVSFRNPEREEASRKMVIENGLAFDWPTERGACPLPKPRYLSLHERGSSIDETLERISKFESASSSSSSSSRVGVTELKLAVRIESFAELKLAHEWQMQNSKGRIFLPMSDDGRWSWYRLLRAGDFSLNFFRESAGSAHDQPTLLQWVRRQKILTRMPAETTFAAVLGDPVSHSRTPMEQAKFFADRKMSVFAIRLTEDEWKTGALAWLAKLGLRAAAVTAPLKKLAFESQSINTLVLDQNGVVDGHNTDLDGLRKAVESNRATLANQKHVAVWGGGGTLGVIREIFPTAQFFSVRTGEPRDGSQAISPDLVIWAGGVARDAGSPPSDWTPKVIFDLNYSDSSPAREYALRKKATYISGLAMFKAQAEAQRVFWSKSFPEART